MATKKYVSTKVKELEEKGMIRDMSSPRFEKSRSRNADVWIYVDAGSIASF